MPLDSMPHIRNHFSKHTTFLLPRHVLEMVLIASKTDTGDYNVRQRAILELICDAVVRC